MVVTRPAKQGGLEHEKSARPRRIVRQEPARTLDGVRPAPDGDEAERPWLSVLMKKLASMTTMPQSARLWMRTDHVVGDDDDTQLDGEDEREYLEDALRTYLREIGRVKLLAARDERRLGRHLETSAYVSKWKRP